MNETHIHYPLLSFVLLFLFAFLLLFIIAFMLMFWSVLSYIILIKLSRVRRGLYKLKQTGQNGELRVQMWVSQILKIHVLIVDRLAYGVEAFSFLGFRWIWVEHCVLYTVYLYCILVNLIPSFYRSYKIPKYIMHDAFCIQGSSENSFYASVCVIIAGG